MIKEVIVVGVIILPLIKLILIKKELRDISQQLRDYSKGDKAKKIEINLIDKDVEQLAQCINEHISISKALQVKQKQSENELKRMIASISHDLRTPLTSIIGYIQVLRSGELSDKRKVDYLETTYRRAKDLQRLIGDFFTLSLVESPEYELNLEYVNLGNILCEVLTNHYDRFVEKGISPKVEVPSESVRIIGDVFALRRVLENLMSNMVKHTQGEVAISLMYEEDEVLLKLVNDAKDMTQHDVQHMFERFYTADTSRGLNGGNTGLGLAIVYELMSKMNGTIKSYLEEEKLVMLCKWKKGE